MNLGPSLTIQTDNRLKTLSLLLSFAMATFVFLTKAPAHAASDDVYKVQKFSVEASAKNAVAAKFQALQEGEKNAFHALMRRLVPGSRYGNLPNISYAQVTKMIEGFSVRSERNSSTRYLATLDYNFSPDAVRALLQKEGLAIVEEQAKKVVIVPILLKKDGTIDKALSFWRKAWLSCDVSNALTPAKISQVRADVTPDQVREILLGDEETFTAVRRSYGIHTLLLAIVDMTKEESYLPVYLTGIDAIGTVSLHRRYLISGSKAKTAKNAAAITLAILEGRWKAKRAGSGAAFAPQGEQQKTTITVEFSGFREWQKIRGKLSKIPGIKNLDVAALSARSAEVTLEYPGGPAGLTGRLAPHELMLEDIGGVWIMRSY